MASDLSFIWTSQISFVSLSYFYHTLIWAILLLLYIQHGDLAFVLWWCEEFPALYTCKFLLSGFEVAALCVMYIRFHVTTKTKVSDAEWKQFPQNNCFEF
jgi:hypothetical protein